MDERDVATPLRVAVIIASTREGREGDRIGEWFAGRVAGHACLDPEVLDLASFALPVRLPETATPAMTSFAGRIGEADAFVVVTPEYNRSFPASLKQAIDCAYDEWHGKPVAFVSYGCRRAGIYAVEQLRGVFTELHVVTMRDTVSFDLFADTVAATGVPDGDAEIDRATAAMLDQLAWWGTALRAARDEQPYVS